MVTEGVEGAVAAAAVVAGSVANAAARRYGDHPELLAADVGAVVDTAVQAVNSRAGQAFIGNLLAAATSQSQRRPR